MWKHKSEMEILDLGYNCYLIKFSLDEDMDFVLTEGPWVIQDHYLTVRKWHANFSPSAATMETTLAWVKFPSLSMKY